MAKKKSSGGSTTGKMMHFVAWFTGVIVSLVVANGMIQGSLGLPSWLGGMTTAGMYITLAIGWIVIITTLLGVVLAILKK
ncbi:MAG: hypothetical protein ABIB79_02665 [archaeon]